MNDAQAERLTVAEMKIQQHEKLHEETAKMIKAISEGVEALVRAEVRREADVQTFERIFAEIAKVRSENKENNDTIRAEIEKIKTEISEYKTQQSYKELKAYQGVVWKGISLAGLVIASVVAARLGAHLLG